MPSRASVTKTSPNRRYEIDICSIYGCTCEKGIIITDTIENYVVSEFQDHTARGGAELDFAWSKDGDRFTVTDGFGYPMEIHASTGEMFKKGYVSTYYS